MRARLAAKGNSHHNSIRSTAVGELESSSMIIRASGLRSWDMMPAEWELRTLRNPPTFARFNRKIVRLDDAHFGFREHLQQQTIVHQRTTESGSARQWRAGPNPVFGDNTLNGAVPPPPLPCLSLSSKISLHTHTVDQIE